ncbi:hypothetical protein E3N88_18963 [Mikania micrantha]|uniref:Uncharacterized protein n=1 Tax=Mikania micrantha TaxID=192012 RepID=A0A5N6NPV5_9ASTR|nr:hypothetical protein E3N88_18963 [Mikania micrantha]
MEVWSIREDGEDFDYDCTYSIENYPDFFSMEVRHGGKFQVNDGKRVYCNGRLSYVDFIPKEFFGLDVLNEIAQAFGYHDTSKMISVILFLGLKKADTFEDKSRVLEKRRHVHLRINQRIRVAITDTGQVYNRRPGLLLVHEVFIVANLSQWHTTMFDVCVLCFRASFTTGRKKGLKPEEKWKG